MIGSTSTRTSRRAARVGALIVAVAVAAGGMSFAGFAGAEGRPESKAAAKATSCHHEGHYIKFTKRPKNPTTKRRATFKFKAPRS